MRLFITAIAALASAVAAPVSAQDTIATRLDKARAEINITENAADRAVAACQRNDTARCGTEARTASNAASRALYAVDRARELVAPVPPPTPPPPPLSGTLAEGDSLSVLWSGNHTGLYAAAHPGERFIGKAVGGSSIATLAARFDTSAAERPARVTVLIGANGLPADFLDRLSAYAARWKATGATVFLSTVTPQCSVTFNARRAEVNPGIRALGYPVIDYAADPVIGPDAAGCDKTLYNDGVHPTEAGQKRAALVYGAKLDGKPAPAAPAPPPPVPNDDLAANVPLIPANFDTAPWLKSAAIPGTMGSDPVGAFRLICQVSWLAAVDPLVEPGVKPSMHLHFGWGNDALDQNSTYASLRTKGSSNCQGGPLYRSAGWAPALLDGDEVIVPDYISTYYKRLPASNPACLTIAAKGCAEFPAGLRFVVSRDYATGLANGTGNNVQFICVGVGGGRTWDVAAKACSPGKQMEAIVIAPDCWDGVRIDSPDHQSHLAYQRRDPNSGRLSCPASHPVLIPQYTVSMFWMVAAGEVPANWTFSLNRVMGTPAGEGFHIDYWEAQEPAVRVAWNVNCIDKHLNCSGGVLGDGRGFVDPAGFSFKAKVRRVAVP